MCHRYRASDYTSSIWNVQRGADWQWLLSSLHLQYRASDFTSSIRNVSSVERAGSSCYTCSDSSLEQATIPIVLGTCQSKERAGSGCYTFCISTIEQATIPEVLGT